MLSYRNLLKRSMVPQLLMAITGLIAGIIVNLLQCSLYIGLRPINKYAYRKINWYLSYTIFSQLLWLAEWWSGSNLIIYMDKNDFEKYVGKNHCLYIMNHTYEIDWLIAIILSDRMYSLGNMKAFTKKVVRYIPVWGWCCKFSDFILVVRSFEKDKEVITKQVAELATYPDPIVLLLCPEGTRFSPEKHKASEEFARMKNLPSLKYHLQPRTRGFITSIPLIREKMPDIFDIILAFKDNDPVKPTMMNLLLGKPITAYLYIKRIPMEDLPHSENELKRFCEDLYARKDKLKDSFVKTGDFFATSGVPRTERLELSRRYFPLVNMVFWAIVVLCPMVYYIALLFSGSPLQCCFGISVIGIFMTVFYIMLRVSEQSTSYGTKNGTSLSKSD